MQSNDHTHFALLIIWSTIDFLWTYGNLYAKLYALHRSELHEEMQSKLYKEMQEEEKKRLTNFTIRVNYVVNPHHLHNLLAGCNNPMQFCIKLQNQRKTDKEMY